MVEVVHNKLNGIYLLAKEIKEVIDEEFKMKSYIETSFKNYININGNYELQHYPIPVIVLEIGVDIGINIDGLFFERFVKKEQTTNIDFKKLVNTFESLELYGGKNCSKDYYLPNKDLNDVFKDIELSTEEEFGLAVYLKYESIDKADLIKMMTTFINSSE